MYLCNIANVTENKCVTREKLGGKTSRVQVLIWQVSNTKEYKSTEITVISFSGPF